MTRTEKIIDTLAHGYIEDHEEEVISELRRLARLCGAYWAEIEALREVRRCACSPDDEPYSDRFYEAKNASKKLTAATDAARREAGEGTT